MKNSIVKILVGVSILSTSAVIISCEGGGNSSSPAAPAVTTPTVTNNGTVVTGQGPYKIKSLPYAVPASVDPNVLDGVQTDVRGQLYMPTNAGGAKLPVIAILHGNHATCATPGAAGVYIPSSCQYTTAATCGSDIEIPNHMGYDYLATKLASWGYVVISINANLGITCGTGTAGDSGLNLARGKLVLKHLSLLEQWSNGTATPPSTLSGLPKGQLDFTQVGLLGHSRGGEGVRAAYNLYRDAGSTWANQTPDLKIRAIFEIGPVDGQTSRVLNADGVAWNVILPSCDGDVSDLEGMRPYDRMLNSSNESPPTPKSMFYVHGANHDFYNTNWQVNDSPGCSAGTTPIFDANSTNSANEQQTAVDAIIPFFRAYVGASPQTAVASILDPSTSLPSDLTAITQVDRAFYLSPSHLIEFRMESFPGTTLVGLFNQPHDLQNVTASHITLPEHDASFSAANIQWSMPTDNTYFQDNLAPAGQGFDFSAVRTLDFRIGRAIDNNPTAQTDLTVELVYLDNTTSQPVVLSTIASPLTGPIGSIAKTHIPLQTIRIPMANFGALKTVRAVRFVFNKTQSGSVYIADLGATRFATYVDVASFLGGATQPGFTNTSDLWDNSPSPINHETTRAVQPPVAAADTTDQNIEVYSSKGFPVTDSLSELVSSDGAVLAVGGSFDHADLKGKKTGDIHYMTFAVDSGEVARHDVKKLVVRLHSAAGDKMDATKDARLRKVESSKTTNKTRN